MLAAKQLIFNGVPKEIFGTILRIATKEDKERNKIPVEEDYLLVEFTYGDVEYRGLWKQSECLLVG
jgi:hypothetical protein